MTGINTIGTDLVNQIRTDLVADATVKAITTKIIRGRASFRGSKGHSRVEIITPDMPETSTTQGPNAWNTVTIAVPITCVTRKGQSSVKLVDAVKKAIRDNVADYRLLQCYNLRFTTTATDTNEIDDKTTEYLTDIIAEWDFYG